MLIGAILSLLLASLLHSWYAGNAKARITQRAIGFMMYGGRVLAVSVAALLFGLACLWISEGFLAALLGAACYFLLLPLIIVPLLNAFRLIPRPD